jgi:hypothetical protein
MPPERTLTKEDIVAACRKHFDEHSDNCSGFVRAVANELGYSLTGNADGILDQIEKGWTKIDRLKAIDAVKAGTLVIAGLKSSEHDPPRNHGHVAVVVDGSLYNGKYPLVWGGSIGSAQSPGTKSVGEVWRKSDRDAVRYYRPKVEPVAQ